MESNRFLNNKQFSINICHNKYHTVSIRSDLPKIPKYYKEEPLQDLPPIDFWIKKLEQNSSVSTNIQRYEIQYNIINGSYTSNCVSHPILIAFLNAYNSHEDIILSPDDTWLMICIYFSKYINRNSTKLNHLYINNQKNRLLTIENDQTVESDWENFLQQIHFEMTNHIKNDICNLLTNKFSTTTKVESLLSSLTIMSTFKKCFDFTYSRNSCGIRNVHFMGTIDDWTLLCNENNQFWDTIFDLKHTKDTSSQSDGIYMNGWFLQLCYGNHTKQTCLMSYIELNSLIVPVQVENEHTNTLKTSYLVGSFHGIISHNEKHKPVLSLVILDDIQSITKLEKSNDE